MMTTRSEKTLKQLDKQQGKNRSSILKRKRQPKRDRGEMDTQKPGHVSLEVKVSQKRATLVKDTPRKRLKMSKTTDAAKSSNVSVDQESTRGLKRKADPNPETPNKKHRGNIKCVATTGEPNNVSEEESNSGNRKRKASTEEEKPSKKRRDSKLQETPSSSSNEEPENDCFKAHTNRDNYEEKYLKLHEIGKGGFGFVYAGIRKADSLPVAIKCILMIHQGHVPQVSESIPREVALMERAGGGPESVGKHAAVSLLDWYYLDDELIIVMERPESSMDMTMYSITHGSYDEQKTKIFMAQLVEAAIDIQNRGVLHNDIKMANILVECGSSTPRLRIIDFGCGRFIQKKCFRSYNGTMSGSEWITDEEHRAEPITVSQLGALMYRMLHNHSFDTWSYITGQLRISDKLSMGCIDFLNLCFASNGKRGTLEQLRLHPWLQ